MIETRINDLITQELKKTESVYELVKNRHRNAPEGCLSISRGRGKPQFYHYKNGKKHYIKKDNYHLAEQLAQKSYDMQVIDVLRDRVEKLEALRKNYSMSVSDIYEGLSVCRQSLVTPILPDRDQALQEWLAAHPGNCNPFPMATGFQTERGDMVRSKSEKIIADLLYRLEIPYVYEAKMELNNKEVVYPDFLLYHPERREILAYEHFGMMGSEEYAGRAIRKIYQYEMSGFTVGINFMYSMECAEQPLNVRAVRLQIERWWNAE